MRLLILFLFFIIGLNVRYYVLIALVLAITLSIILIRNNRKVLLGCALIPFVFGIGLSFLNFNIVSSSYTGFVCESKDNYFILFTGLERIYIPLKNNSFEIGDVVSITGMKTSFSFTIIESQFDFAAYLNKKGIIYQIDDPSISIIFQTPLRLHSLRNQFLAHFDDDVGLFIKAILFGENSGGSLNATFSDLHLGRLLSISGLYLYAFIAFLRFIFEKFMKEKWAKLTALAVLTPYLIFTFPKFSVLKISFIYVLRWLNEYRWNKRYSNETIIAFSGFFFLIFDYHLANTDSFILSYSVPLFVTIFNQSFVINRKRKKKFLLALAVLMFLIPFSIRLNNGVSLLTPLYQLVFTPLMILIAFVCLLCFCHIPLYTPLNYALSGFGNFTKFLSKLPVSFNLPPLDEWQILLYYIIFFGILYILAIYYRPLKKLLFIVAVSLCTLYVLPIQNFISQEVSFINVGQGDACLVRKGTTSVLIDTGGSIYKDIARDCLIPYLKKKRIYNLDLVITTHDDYDHSGAFASLNENFRVKKYVSAYTQFPLEINGIKFTNYNVYPSFWQEENDQSLVIGFTLANYHFLIMGDAPIKIEKQIMNNFPNIPCDVLKVGHHGSNTSTSDAFVKFLKPKEAVVSVGKNYYGHPKKSVLNILKANNVIIKRTDQLGTITYQKLL